MSNPICWMLSCLFIYSFPFSKKRYIKLERGSVYSVLAVLEYEVSNWEDMVVQYRLPSCYRRMYKLLLERTIYSRSKTYSDKTHGMNCIALDKKYPTVMLTFSQLYTFEVTFNELVQRCFLLNVWNQFPSSCPCRNTTGVRQKSVRVINIFGQIPFAGFSQKRLVFNAMIVIQNILRVA